MDFLFFLLGIAAVAVALISIKNSSPNPVHHSTHHSE